MIHISKGILQNALQSFDCILCVSEFVRQPAGGPAGQSGGDVSLYAGVRRRTSHVGGGGYATGRNGEAARRFLLHHGLQRRGPHL